jgi:hypothetical protein
VSSIGVSGTGEKLVLLLLCRACLGQRTILELGTGSEWAGVF